MHPFQGSHKVGQGDICRIFIFRAVGGKIKAAQDIQSVVDSHDHNIAEFAEILSVVVHAFDGGAVYETAAVEEYHHGLFCSRIKSWRPYVQIQAVFILYPETARPDKGIGTDNGLIFNRAGGAVSLCVSDAFPRADLARLLVSAGSGVRDAEETVGIIVHETSQGSGLDFYDRRIIIHGPFIDFSFHILIAPFFLRKAQTGY